MRTEIEVTPASTIQQQLDAQDLVRYVLADPRVFAVLANEKGCVPIAEKQQVTGFEAYIVEQWAVERRLNAAVTSYTGNVENKISVSVIGLPRDSARWTAPVKQYFDGMVRLHSRPKETELGLIFVTNLSSFPSNLNLVPVPTGDIRTAAQLFVVNQDLKRTGCGGRLVLSICAPTDAGEAKFRQIFRPHERVPIMFAVVEMVTMIQIVLVYCGLLEPEFADGLLCNKTLAAVQAWWKHSGQLRFGGRGPVSDGFGQMTLSPATVAAIIGFITGVRNRLNTLNYKPPKDPFDADEFVLTIKAFQKHEHLPKTMRLDNTTISRLYSITDKSSNTADFIGMVKTTMKEVSGKQVQSMADSETLDLDRLIPNLQGRRARYLWAGKGHPRSLNRCGYSELTGIPLSSLSPSEVGSTSEQRRIRPSGGAIVTKIRNLPRRQTGSDSVDDIEETSMRDRMRRYLTPGEGSSGRGGSRQHHLLRHQRNLSSSFYSSDDNESDVEVTRDQRDLDVMSGGEDDVADCKELEACGVEQTNEFSAACPPAIQRCQLARSYSCGCLGKYKQEPPIGGVAAAGPQQQRPRLRRASSFSVVEEAVLGWDFEFPSELLAEMYLHTKQQQHMLEQQIMSTQMLSTEYSSRLQGAGKSVMVNKEIVGKMKAQSQGVARKEHQLKADIQRAEVLAARLKYEIRVLESKIHDVEDSVDSFQAKVSEMERRCRMLCACSSRPSTLPSNSSLPSSSTNPSPVWGKLSSFTNSILGYFASFASYSAHASTSNTE